MSSAEAIAKTWRLSRKAALQRRSRRLLAAPVVQAIIVMAACSGSAQWPRNQQETHGSNTWLWLLWLFPTTLEHVCRSAHTSNELAPPRAQRARKRHRRDALPQNPARLI